MLLEDSSVLAIPDPKWHFFKNTGETLHGNITTSTPVLRACAVYEVFEAYFYKGQPRTELLLSFPHVKGEHLFNLTLANENFYVNKKFYVHVTWALQEVRTSVRFHKSARLSRVRATHETGRELSIGNGNMTTPKIPWVYNSVPNPEPHRAINGMTSFPCSEMKIKVTDGYVDYQIGWISVAFPTEPYDDTFFTTTTTTIASTVTTQRQDHTGFETTPSETETNKASLTTGIIFAVGGVLVIVAAGFLFYVGFRIGQCHGNITSSTPVLRACAVYEVFKIYFYKGQPRTELLLLFQHVKGEHLVNITLVNDKLYVNRKFYVRVRWTLQDIRISVVLEKNKRRNRIWADSETFKKLSLGNGNVTTPKIPWVYHSVANPAPSRDNRRTSYPCSEVKIKVTDGYVDYQVEWAEMGFPSEPYDDTFFTTTTTTAATTTATTRRQDHTDFETTTPETVTNEASVTTVLIFAIGGVLAMVAAGIVFFVGFRIGQWYAKRAAVKQRLL